MGCATANICVSGAQQKDTAAPRYAACPASRPDEVHQFKARRTRIHSLHTAVSLELNRARLRSAWQMKTTAKQQGLNPAAQRRRRAA